MSVTPRCCVSHLTAASHIGIHHISRNATLCNRAFVLMSHAHSALQILTNGAMSFANSLQCLGVDELNEA